MDTTMNAHNTTAFTKSALRIQTTPLESQEENGTTMCVSNFNTTRNNILLTKQENKTNTSRASDKSQHMMRKYGSNKKITFRADYVDPEKCVEARKELKNDVFRAMRQSMTKTPPIARRKGGYQIAFDTTVFSESHHSLTKRSKTQIKTI